MKKQELVEKIENDFKKKHILVIGDLMVDRYISGKVRKISPEAPVPVLDYTERKFVAGGASNVVKNLLGLGAQVHVAGVIADDMPGDWLTKDLESSGAIMDSIFIDNDRPTTMKTRYTTNGIQLLRVDKEEKSDISDSAKEFILSYLKTNSKIINAVILSDYLKGVLKDKNFISSVISECQNNNIFVAVDTKTDSIGTFAGADMMTPNVDEVSSAVGVKIESNEGLDIAGKKYLAESGTAALLLTRGEKGISVFEKSKMRMDFPAKDVEVFDVSGAGDTVISTITLARISGLEMSNAVELGNLAAGVVITKRGTAAIKKDELLRSINEI